jgi:acyl dehydratase
VTDARFAPYVGRQSEPLTVEVERGHVRRFAEAVGDANPIYVDEAAARAAGHPRIPAPPTFAVALRANDPRAGIELDWRKLLHGEQEFVFQRSLYVGDRLTLTARIADAAVKETKSGVMDVMVLETVATDGDGARVFSARSTVLVRR